MRVSTLARSHSAPTLTRNTPPPEVKTDWATHWNSVARDQAFARQPQRRQALETAHALVEQVLIREGAPASIRAELAQMELPDPNLSPEAFEQVENTFAESLGTLLTNLARSKADNVTDFEPPKYGGEIGDQIFQSFTAQVTVPAMKGFIGALAQATEAVPVDEAREQVNAALGPLVDMGSYDRGLIARMTGTKNAHLFGERIPPEGRLRDPVSERPTWKNWSNRMTKEINAHFLNGRFSKARPSDLWPNSSIQWLTDKTLHVVTTRDGRTRLALDATATHGVYESCSGVGVRFTFRQFKSSIVDIECHHVPTPAQEPTETTFQDEFFELIRMRDPAPADLQQGLARLLHRISTSSLLFRGGAAFTERLMQALANHHGFQLTYSADWTPPGGIPPDQQALGDFHIDEFVRTGSANLILTPSLPG